MSDELPPGLFLRGAVLWMRFKNAAGEWVSSSTGCRLEQLEVAKRVQAKALASISSSKPYAAPVTGLVTVASYGAAWVKVREDSDVASARNERTHLEMHIFPVLGALEINRVEPKQVRAFVKALREKKSASKPKKGKAAGLSTLAPRTVRHIFGTLRLLFRHAVAEELATANPCVLLPGELPGKVDKDPTWRRSAVFTRGELEALISDARIPQDRRVWHALQLLGGLRVGEACELRWRDHDPALEPLGRLDISRAWSRNLKKAKGTKTEVPREVPIHPVLAKVLAAWKLTGYQALIGKKPGPDDLVIPSRDGGPREASTLDTFHEDLERLGLRKRRLHDCRRTFISLARAGGATKDVLRWVSHGVALDIIDDYTTLPWATRCEAVSGLKAGLLDSGVVALPLAVGASGGPGAGESAQMAVTSLVTVAVR